MATLTASTSSATYTAIPTNVDAPSSISITLKKRLLLSLFAVLCVWVIMMFTVENEGGGLGKSTPSVFRSASSNATLNCNNTSESQEIIPHLKDELEHSRARIKEYESRAQQMEVELETMRVAKAKLIKEKEEEDETKKGGGNNIVEALPTTRTGVAIACMFNHKTDPQRTGHKVTDPVAYAREWTKSLLKHPTMTGVILGNMYDEKTQKALTTDRLSFVEINPMDDKFRQQAERLSTNDFVYIAVESYMQSVAANNTSFKNDYVLITDLGDVTFLKNPFPFMWQTDDLIGSPQIYVQEEAPPTADAFNWLQSVWDRCALAGKMPRGNKFYSSGIVGARVDSMLHFLAKVNAMLLSRPKEQNCNMCVFEKLLVETYKTDVISGYPFHAKFKGYEKNSNAFIKHKL